MPANSRGVVCPKSGGSVKGQLLNEGSCIRQDVILLALLWTIFLQQWPCFEFLAFSSAALAVASSTFWRDPLMGWPSIVVSPNCLGPPVVPFYPFLGEGSTTKIDYRELRKGHPCSNLSAGQPMRHPMFIRPILINRHVQGLWTSQGLIVI